MIPFRAKRRRRPDLRRDCDQGLRRQGLRREGWRRRPDLRRDCDAGNSFNFRQCSPKDDEDLIYEGIATITTINETSSSIDDEDLIYEGIATIELD